MSKKTILNLNHMEARQFFLENKSYVNFNLPPYFNFEDILEELSSYIGEENYQTFFRPQDANNFENNEKLHPKNYADINYKLLSNKDGKYDWRPLQLINPFLYVSLVHLITNEEYWNEVTTFFLKNTSEKIRCESIPLISSEAKIPSTKELQIDSWISGIEEESLKMALSFRYSFETDISNCYGSIYTHSFSWALIGKSASKNGGDKHKLGWKIDKILMSMNYGQTNGIPQGSALMDLLAEIILSYADKLILSKLEDLNDFKILRYRDDYRIFVNRKDEGEKILKTISGVLSELGMKLNSEKTKDSEDILLSSIKSDKLYLINNPVIQEDLVRQLLAIYSIAERYPNSGSIDRLLTNFYKTISETKDMIWLLKPEVLISIVMNIAIKNPRAYSISSLILSLLLSETQNKDSIILLIMNKLKNISNVDLFEIWMQRLLIKNTNYDSDYKGTFLNKLSKAVDFEDVDLWNNTWLNEEVNNIFLRNSIFKEEVAEDLNPLISDDEVEIYHYRG